MSRRTQRDVVFVERESSSPLWWLVVGGALGAGLALLFAPEPGEKTRLGLARRLKGLRASAKEVLDEFREAASDDAADDDELAEGALDGEAELEEDADDEAQDDDDEALRDGKRAEPNPRAELEKRLAAARARRQRSFADEDEEPVA